MADKIYISGNACIVQDSVTADITKDTLKSQLYYDSEELEQNDNVVITFFQEKENAQTYWYSGTLSNVQKKDGSSYTKQEFREFCNFNLGRLDDFSGERLLNRIVVNSAIDFGTIDSTKQYFIDVEVDMGNTSIEVPSTGLFINGYNLDLSKLTSSENSYTMFTSPGGGSGNVFVSNISLEASGTDSQVLDLTADTGFEAVEFNLVNFNNCTAIGELQDYRQVLEVGTGRFGSTPVITLHGSMNGYRVTTSIVRSISNMGTLFKAGTNLVFSGRFVSDINCDLPATGALIDFSPTNFTNDESLIFNGAFISRQGVLDPTDTTIYPNIDETSEKSNWKNNTGLPNTQKYIRSTITTETQTVINTVSVYELLEGTFTVSKESHFDMPTNGEFRLLSGAGSYQFFGDLLIEGGPNDVLSLRITKSSDGGTTWPTVIGSIRRQVNSFVGGRDIAFFPINFLEELEEDDRVRLEIANLTDTTNVTAELDSSFIITEV